LSWIWREQVARRFGRRAVLRAAGVALALPWLESLAPRLARGQSLAAPKRFLPVFFPQGTGSFWRPAGVGAGAAWQLSPVLQPLAPLKEQVTVLGNVQNYSCFSELEQRPEPSDSRSPGAFLTCVDAVAVRRRLGVQDANGISADQLMAQSLPLETRFDSLQLGLSTIDAYCDGQPCSLSRSISWRSPTEPLYKLVDPQAVWDKLFTGSGAPVDPAQARLDKSVLDAVLASSQGLEQHLSADDRSRLDQYLTSLRATEQKLGTLRQATCRAPPRPTLSAHVGLSNSDNYDRGLHFDVMNELLALALQCDLTRTISYMLDDARSEFNYTNVSKRHFSATGSAATTGICGNFHGSTLAGDSNDDWASISWWLTAKLSELCQKLASMPEADGSVLDSTVVVYASSMGNSSGQMTDLPIALIGGKKLLKTNQHLVFDTEQPLRDLYFTLLTQCFGVDVPSFGDDLRGTPQRVMSELLL
jgi:hypothetical protein